MHSVLEILAGEARCSAEEIALRLGLEVGEVEAKIAEYERNHVILGYHAVVNWHQADDQRLFAFIEVKASPERGQGFDRLAEHIAGFEEVHSVHLVSGTHDLNVVIQGRDFREVALFVAEKLAPLEQVQSTATSFVLKSYKVEGQLIHSEGEDQRLAVTP
ncbi:MAG: Lrp/AsnC family transcriptional regulator [Armatimonadetes bacterium]|nr:Lrp/AsnC family transcriptional regulator [Armatimonadota bacterium]